MRKIDEKTIRDFISSHGRTITSETTEHGNLMLRIDRGFYNENHDRDCIFINSNGTIVYHGHHNSVKDKHSITEAMKAADPDYFKKSVPKAAAESKQFDRQTILSAVQKLSEIEQTEVRWISSPLIPRSEQIIIGGPGGAGKGVALASILEGITNGHASQLTQYAGPFQSEKESVLYLTTEDPADKVLRKRLEAAGADLNMITIIDKTNPVIHEINFADDNEILNTLLSETRPSIVVFDPIQSFLPDRVRMSERNQIRRCMNHLSVLSGKYGTTFIIICHTNKRDATDARQTLADSADIWDLTRSVIFVGDTGKGNVKYLSHEKSNYATPAETVLFTIEDPGVARFAGYTDKRFKDFQMEKNQKDFSAPQRETAKEIIVSTLAAAPDKSMKIKELDELCSASGVSRSTLKRAKTELKSNGRIKMWSQGFDKGEKTWLVRLVEETTIEPVPP